MLFAVLSLPMPGGPQPDSFSNSSFVSYASVTQKDKSIPFLALYCFATPAGKLQLVLGAVLAGVNGTIFPCMALVFGTAINAFAQADGGVVLDAVNSRPLPNRCSAVHHGLAGLHHLLLQLGGAADEATPSSCPAASRGDTVKIKDGMGQKLSDSIKFTCQFVVGYAIGFTRDWGMSLFMACVMPFMVFSLKYMVRLFRKRAVLTQ
ncbi:hypothetical protein PF005_g28997 [Phytophthora fragariae]|uniref:ABC transmembrane type-1 domain-containing protein n=1 Tax=Phytophthora fragariae TaxID=53985 RepID=A0A6A3VIW3_9STRA|nr:hypothetical protein PF011_g27859 [Phytophthora fragariae]KAE9166924.1 hypothetical protein PF005_g28997 [Phytophthora fragariae]KAE9279458.1 hypothetical protein PF008_g28363 [Phytophthora fragariae]